VLLTSSLLALSTGLAPGLVARVADRPIPKTEADRWMVIADKADGSTGDDPAELRPQAVEFLVALEWIDLEARRLGVKVSDATVAAAIRRQYPDADDLAEHLTQTGQTEEDLKRRLRSDLQAQGIQRSVRARAKTRSGRDRVLERYLTRFDARYRRMTVCGTGYHVRRVCGHEVPLSA
jgi:SurA N-terminal domain